jgi:dihydroorotase
MMRSVLRACAEAGLAFMQHCQEPTLTRGAAMHAGPTALRLGLAGWPRSAEEIIIERDVRLLRDTGGRYHVQHISSAGSVEIVRDARAQGLAVTAEASPHHLLLTDEACNGYDTNAKMNPPLREHRDVEALRAGVAQGVITVLATDHAPHTADEKALPFDQAPFGIVGLETAVAAYAAALVDPGLIGWPRLIALMTAEPARLCNLDVLGRGIDALGTLRVGGPADVTIIDPDQAWTVGLDDFAGRSRNSPFIGTRFTVRPVATIVAGRVVHEYSPARA